MKIYSRLFLTAIMILTTLGSVKAVAPANDNFAGAQNLGSTLSGSVSGGNADATQEADEPTHYVANPNKQSVWYKWTAPATRSMSFEEIDQNFASAMAIYTADAANPTFAQLTKVESNADILGYNYTGCRINFLAQSGKTYYIAVDYANAGGPGAVTGSFELKFFPNAFGYSTKFDSRNHRASVGIYRPSNGMWYFLWNMSSVSNESLYGKAGDMPVPADYNGDGRTDIAVVRNENGAKLWYVSFQSTTVWGLPTDTALTGDFDDDGRADLTAIRSNGQNLVWYVRRSTDASMTAFTWGIPTDKPTVGDFDGDRLTDVAVTRSTPNGLVWYILKSNGGAYNQYTSLQFGIDSDVTSVEDYDGDGKADLAIFRPSEGNWYFWLSGSDTQKIVHWGTATDMPTTSINPLLQQ